jgi:hypothetical protein
VERRHHRDVGRPGRQQRQARRGGLVHVHDVEVPRGQPAPYLRGRPRPKAGAPPTRCTAPRRRGRRARRTRQPVDSRGRASTLTCDPWPTSASASSARGAAHRRARPGSRHRPGRPSPCAPRRPGASAPGRRRTPAAPCASPPATP